MSTVDEYELFSSGGHRWQWGRAAVTRKDLATAGTRGVGSMTTHIGAQQVTITGILKGATDLAVNLLETDITPYVAYGSIVAWEDDQGRSGDALQLTDYIRGKRLYGKVSGVSVVWQHYTVMGRELLGGPDGEY